MRIPNDLAKVFQIACQNDCTVLVTGPTGTGKSTLAHEIHRGSRRRLAPFIVVNLASLSEGVLESELFGHERGSFTGADQKRQGRLEAAQGGTVFLDEVGELTPRLQARLLEFLQSRTICPVGGNRTITLNVRVIAATHKNLEKSVARGEFREDLYHRLRVVTIGIHSLSERKEELPWLAQSCLSELAKTHSKPVAGISDSVIQKFKEYPWPGNIRELRNTIEYSLLSAESNFIQTGDLPPWFEKDLAQSKLRLIAGAPFFEGATLGVAEIPLTLNHQDTLQRLEKEYLRRALARNGGRINRTARQIGMNKTTLLRRIKAYSLLLGEA